MIAMTLDEAFRKLAVFDTRRFRVRPLKASDAKGLFSVKGDPEVTRMYGMDPHRSLARTRKWVRDRLSDYRKRNGMIWTIVPKKRAAAIGSVVFWNFDETFHTAELGYELGRSHWGRRVMSEALPPVIAYGFGVIGLNRIEACPFADNEASNRLLKRLGFQYEGTLRQRIFYEGRYTDQLYYGLLRSEASPS